MLPLQGTKQKKKYKSRQLPFLCVVFFFIIWPASISRTLSTQIE